MKTNLVPYIAKNITIVVALVLIWRGIWELLDKIDYALFGGSHVVTAIGGIVVGLLLLYVPDKDLKEIEKM